MNKNIDEIKHYFTDDIRERIKEMTNQEMKDALKGLEGTETWFAILKYSQERVSVIQDAFLTLDPIKESVKIARYQGAITGMLDLQDAVLSLKFTAKKAENPKYQEEVDKDELGGAYGVV